METEDPSSPARPEPGRERGHWFATTRWSLVARAASPENPDFAAALEALCVAYRPPLLAYLRRAGYGPEDSEDLAQGFFTWLIERNPLPAADPAKGKFRSFLLGTLKHFLSDQRKWRTALKRGGGRADVSLDELAAQVPGNSEPAVEAASAMAFDRHWALTMLEHSAATLRADYEAQGKGDVHEALRGFRLNQPNASSYAAAAERLGISEAAVKSAIRRLRQRHAELLRDEVTRTVAEPQDVDDELRYLIALLGG